MNLNAFIRLQLARDYLIEAHVDTDDMRLRDWFHLVLVHAFSPWKTKPTWHFVFHTLFKVVRIRRVTLRGKTAGFVFITKRRLGLFSLDAYPCSRSRFALTAGPACAIWVVEWFTRTHPGIPLFAEIARENRAARHSLKAIGFTVFKTAMKREVWRYG